MAQMLVTSLSPNDAIGIAILSGKTYTYESDERKNETKIPSFS